MNQQRVERTILARFTLFFTQSLSRTRVISLCFYARRGTRRPHQCLSFVLAFWVFVQWQRDLYHTTKALHAEYLTSYTNMLQLIDYQYFTQCKMLPMSPTCNLHNPHTATRHKHGRTISRHRGAEKSVAPTDLSTSLWRITHRIRQNRLRSSGV